MNRTSPAQKGYLGLFAVVLVMIISRSAWSRPLAGASAQDVSPLFLPVVSHNFDPLLGVPLFGVQMYGDTGSSSNYHADLLATGASWVRVPLSWRSVEPVNTSPEGMNWSSTDIILAAARADMGGLNVIATITTSPAWAVEDWNSDLNLNPDPTDPRLNVPIDFEDLGEFAEFVGAMVERYDGDGYQDASGSPVVNHWEFDNEPDSGDASWSPHWGDHGGQYAQMLATVYPAVKAASSKAQVLLGGIAYDWFYPAGNFIPDFLDDVLNAGGGDYFDVMNFHYYPAFASNWLPPGSQSVGLIEKTRALRAKLAAHGYRDKPFVITEAGWHSDQQAAPPSTPEIQARYVVELFTQSLAADIDVMIWWSMFDPGGFYSANGLVTQDVPPARKRAFNVYKALVAELGTAHFERVLPLAETGAAEMEVYRFSDNVYQRKVYVAWLNPVETGAVKSLRLPAATATVRDFYGNVIATPVSSGDGQVTIQVSGRPVYVEVSK